MLMITMKKQIGLWKKGFAVCFSVALVFTLAGCSKEEKLKPEKSSQQTSSSQQETPSKNAEKQDQTKKEKDNAASTPSNQKEIVKESERKGDYDAALSGLKASRDDDMLRLDLTCSGDENGKIYLSDGATTNVGPIDIQKGDYTVYFLLNADSNTTYTLTIEAASGKKAEFNITPKMIQAAMNETTIDQNDDKE